jgi:hypothetical protein
MADPTNEQRKAIGAFVKGTLSPLIEEVLTKKLTQAAAFVAEEMRAEAALAESVTDEQIQAVWESMPGGPGGFRKQWGFNQFARAILALTAHDSGVPAAPVPQPPQWPAGLLDRIKAAEQRIADNHAPRRIPADPHGDVDLVLAEVRYLIEGRWPPFWIKDASGVEAPPATPAIQPAQFCKWAGGEGYDTAHTYDTERGRWVFLNPMTADLWKCWNAARTAGVTGLDHQTIPPSPPDGADR